MYKANDEEAKKQSVPSEAGTADLVSRCREEKAKMRKVMPMVVSRTDLALR